MVSSRDSSSDRIIFMRPITCIRIAAAGRAAKGNSPSAKALAPVAPQVAVRLPTILHPIAGLLGADD